ncbi:MAG: hypothetical protein GX181_06105 [Synergistaceae bacterium]|nr:hypothetical protein [Synergistota bacterium]NLM71512.1 hypothetical protein [Synergistaceae bacterium]
MTEELKEKILFDEIRKLVDSEGLVTARLVEAINRTAQMSSASVPEIQLLFEKWISLVGNEVLRFAERAPEMNIEMVAKDIGIGETSLLSILLAMQRQGRIKIESVHIAKGSGQDNEICSCLRRNED